MIRVYVEGIGVRGEGLDGWPAAAAVLAGRRDYLPAPVALPVNTLLPANERRRMVTTVKLALAVGTEAFANAKRDPGGTATVFTSSGGDGDTIHNILDALACEQIEVSPMRFHNSVHNAPSGYWSIATKAVEPTTSLCVHDASFSAGLLEAAAQATVDHRAVGLIAYDLPYPAPLNAVRPIGSTFAVGLIITPAPSEASFASLAVALTQGNEPPTAMAEPRLEAIRLGNPAARSLPLLAALARDIEAKVILEYLGNDTVTVSTTPLPLALAAQ
ncbi:MAG TPA: beta-ketoacyl synthase chain length factor [Stellaceae bacterium]|nr:beta-ketoacyl synthase chain length factor [Stellaceae bacterium]